MKWLYLILILWGKPALQLILVRYPNLNKIDLLYSFLVIRSLNRAHIKNEKSAGFWKLNAFVIFLNKDFWPFRRQRAETSFGKSVTHGGILNLKKETIYLYSKCHSCMLWLPDKMSSLPDFLWQLETLLKLLNWFCPELMKRRTKKWVIPVTHICFTIFAMKIMACGFFASAMRFSDGKNGFLKIFWMNIFFCVQQKKSFTFSTILLF